MKGPERLYLSVKVVENMKKPEKIFRNGSDVYVRTAHDSSLLSANCHRIDFNHSAGAPLEILSAIHKLSELDNSSQLRLDAISNGKAIIANWHPPTGEEIDVIIANMKKRLMA